MQCGVIHEGNGKSSPVGTDYIDAAAQQGQIMAENVRTRSHIYKNASPGRGAGYDIEESPSCGRQTFFQQCRDVGRIDPFRQNDIMPAVGNAGNPENPACPLSEAGGSLGQNLGESLANSTVSCYI